jgi:hypothetical protein
MEEGSKVNDFMKIIKEIFNKLVKFEDIFSNNMVVEQVINALLGSYDTFTHVISNERKMPTLEDLFRQMQSKEN